MRLKTSGLESVKNKPHFGAGESSLIAAIIWQTFQDCYAREWYTRIEAANWLVEVGADYWKAIGLDTDDYKLALDRLMPRNLRHINRKRIRDKLLQYQTKEAAKPPKTKLSRAMKRKRDLEATAVNALYREFLVVVRGEL